jgi:hypothetical protein
MFKSIFHYLNTHKTFLAQVVLVIVFIGVLAWGASISVSQPQPTEIPEGGPTLTATPILTTTPVEFTPNQNETEGIIFAGILLVLIIVVGTLGVINQRD